MINKMKSTNAIVYCVLFAIGTILVLYANIFGRVQFYERDERSSGVVIEPTTKEQLTEDLRQFTFSAKALDEEECLLFFTNHQCVRAYSDGELIYSVSKNHGILGTTPGVYWNFIAVPNDSETLVVQVEAVYSEVRQDEIHFIIGNEKQMYQELITKSIPETTISIVDILIGVCMLVCWNVSRRRKHEERSTLYFSIFSILLGLWSLNETIFVRLVMQNRIASTVDAYIFLLLILVPYTYFIESFLEVKKTKVVQIYCAVCNVFAVGLTILHMTHSFEFKRTLFLIHILMGVEIFASIGMIISRIKKKGLERKGMISLVGIIAFFCAFVSDIFAYYEGKEKTDSIGRIALLIYMLMLVHEIVLGMLENTEELKKAEIYRELAMKDTLTGLYNRNAYNQWLEENKENKDVAVLMCDLNDLKKCNDTRGHSAGDSYIVEAADIISKVFQEDGACYRIGGDEFCVILEGADDIDIPKKIDQLNEMQEECNRMFAEMKINIAYGYAVFDYEKDSNIEDTCKRADEKMYRNKKDKKRNS